MKKNKIKSIQIIGKEWFDKINGNSYFSTRIYIDGEEIARCQFQYGYGSQYEHESGLILDKLGYVKLEKYNNGMSQSLWRYCQENGIKLIQNLQTRCKKSEVKDWGITICLN